MLNVLWIRTQTLPKGKERVVIKVFWEALRKHLWRRLDLCLVFATDGKLACNFTDNYLKNDIFLEIANLFWNSFPWKVSMFSALKIYRKLLSIKHFTFHFNFSVFVCLCVCVCECIWVFACKSVYTLNMTKENLRKKGKKGSI